MSTVRTALSALGLALSLALAAPAAGAADLLQAWEAAQARDPALAAARADRAAGQARADQADGLWRPTLEARASAGRATQETWIRGARFAAPGLGSMQEADFDTSITGGTRTEYGIRLRQPLIDPGRDAEAGRLRHAAARAEAAWTAARQQAALQVAERYFDVLLGERARAALEVQRQAVARLLGQARARYRIGDGSILDTHEAQARLGQVEALVRDADTQLEIARAAFQDVTGLPAQALAPLRRDAPVLTAAPDEPLTDWLARVERAGPAVLESLEAAAMAQRQADRARAAMRPSLDLVGEAGRSHLTGSGAFGEASQTANQWTVGLELRIPLYSGGVSDARYREALAERDGARHRAAADRQRAALLARAAWLRLDAGAARIQALRQALEASAARRDATRLGVEEGERTTLDRLDAEREYAQAGLALDRALAALALDRLQLRALAGALDEAALESINQALGPEPSPTRSSTRP
ncbi:TolC family protein [Castellaniella defragrans]|uniref:TolC family protein n=1 Tax=Castellaniella defragrans TaxID=75697 RepID=UPI0023F35B67|nr:TolC family protein [Castellaniella defragrans]